MVRKQASTQHGFTLLEIIAVLVILGILAAVIFSRFTSFDAEVYTGADALKTHLRYAQTQAMNRDPNAGGETIMGITYDVSANQYWLFRGTNKADIQLLPDDAQYAASDRKIDLNAKQIRLDSAFTIYFDDHGIPYSVYVNAIKNVPLANVQTIMVTGASGGAPSVSVTITPKTGFVP
jgi:MSHA pilin protein MshC